MPNGYPIGGVTAYGSLMGEYWYTPPGRETVRPYFFQDNERLPQYLTEGVLRTRLAAIPSVRTYFGWVADSFEQDEGSVRVAIAEDGGSGQRVLTADYLVGCDGGRSMVREQLGIRRSGPDFQEKMVLALFRSRSLHEALKRFPERTTYRVLHPDLKGAWMFFGRVDVGEGWFFHAPVPQDATPITTTTTGWYSGRRALLLRPSLTTLATGICGSRRQTVTGRAGRSLPATRATPIRPMGGTA